jgi:hypothetical protein
VVKATESNIQAFRNEMEEQEHNSEEAAVT